MVRSLLLVEIRDHQGAEFDVGKGVEWRRGQGGRRTTAGFPYAGVDVDPLAICRRKEAVWQRHLVKRA